MKIRQVFLVLLTALTLFAGQSYAAEFRGLYATAWHYGFQNSTEATTLVNTAKNNNFNAIIMQVRKRGDAYYFPTAPNYDIRASGLGSYDPLADVITKAHAQGIKVYAWIVNNLIWSDAQNSPPANHVMSLHPSWLMKDSAGNTFIGEGYFLDPGHPDAMTWNYNVCMDLVQHYDIDGLMFDYIRYPRQDSGYNDTAIARFNNEFGRTGLPSPSDTTFSDWRRRQVTDFVKKVYANAVAIKPNIVISAATFASRSDAYTYRFQDWATWMSKGYLDANMPMNYTTSNSTFNSRTDDTYNYRAGRHVYIAQGSYMNTISNSMTQLGYVRQKGCEGMGIYTYAVTNSEGRPNSDFYATLKAQLFTSPDNTPSMIWKTSPTQGILKGTVTRALDGAVIYNATVTINSQTDKSDGTGFYALTKLTPGTYQATCSAPGYFSSNANVTISAGAVTTQNFVLAQDVTPPVISNVQAASIYANTATITWTTNEASTSQVEYGPTTSYGNETLENTALVTSHSEMLTGLSPNTTYHYRVKSKDGSNNQSVSGDFVFTTASPTQVQDIIIDNVDPGFSIYNSWSTGTSSTDKYGTNYMYCTTASSETRYARWTPDIVTPGNYEVYVWYPEGTNRSVRAPYTVYYAGGNQTFQINQRDLGGQWNLLGTFTFNAGNSGYVKLSNNTGETSLNVMADAVKFRFAGDTTPPVISNIQTSGITQTQCTITWTTNEFSDSLVVYGPTTAYGNTSGYDPDLVTSHSVTITGLTPGTLYHFQVESADGFGNLAQSVDQTFTTQADTVAPIISNILATDITDTTATIQWDTNEPANSEVVYGKTLAYGGTASDPAYVTVHGVTLTGLESNTLYHYRVKSRDPYNNLTTSLDKTFRTDDMTPPAFSGLESARETCWDGQSVLLTWQPATDATPPVSYRIYMGTSPGGEDFVYPIAETTENYYTVTGLSFGQTYYFVVRALDSASPPNVDTNTVERSATLKNILVESGLDGVNQYCYTNLSGMSTVAYDKSTAPLCTLNIPVWEGHPLYTPGGTVNQARFVPPVPLNGLYKVYQTWGSGGPNCKHVRFETNLDGGTKDVIYLDQAGAGTLQNSNTWLEVANNPVPMLAGSSVYCIMDDSENQGPAHDGNAGRIYTDGLRIEYVGPALPAPQNLTATGSATAISLSWSPVDGAAGYRIYRSGASGSFTLVPLDTAPGAAYTDNAVVTGQGYYYIVRAIDGSGSAGFASNEAYATATATTDYHTTGGFVKLNKWNLVSVPADPVNPDPLVVFSIIDVANSSFQYWLNNVDGGGYQSYGSLFGWTGPILRGVPYWFLTSGTGPDKDMRFDGFPPTTDFELTVPAHQSSPFWIMFGTPFPNAVLASNVRFKNIAKRGDVWLTWAEAFSESNPQLRILDSNAQGWEAANNRFVSVTPPEYIGEQDRFEPWWGYWLLVYDANELKIRFSKP